METSRALLRSGKAPSIHHGITGRASSAQFGATIRSPIPDFYEPQMLKFNSEKGMMVVGFEEVDGRRYYQGWWITWRNLMA